MQTNRTKWLQRLNRAKETIKHSTSIISLTGNIYILGVVTGKPYSTCKSIEECSLPSSNNFESRDVKINMALYNLIGRQW